MSEDKTRFMRQCLLMAKRGIGRTFPNPMVGAVVVYKGKIIGQGYHKASGMPHAEVNAIRSVKDKSLLSQSTLYVSLEPCSHFGKTPPCTELILKSNIPSVVIAVKDPNPKVSGRGIAMLRKHGVHVTIGTLATDAAELNEAFFHFHKTGRPRITFKTAQSLDGKIALVNGQSKWISSVEARKVAHKLRSEHQAVLTTSRTILVDNPKLTVRMVKGHQPMLIVLDRTLCISPKANVFSAQSEVLLVTSKKNTKHPKLDTFRRMKHVDVAFVSEKENRLALLDVFSELAARGTVSILVEAGGTLIASLVKQNLVDEFYLFIAPMFLGAEGLPSIASLGLSELNKAPALDQRYKLQRVGKDLLITGTFKKKKSCPSESFLQPKKERKSNISRVENRIFRC